MTVRYTGTLEYSFLESTNRVIVEVLFGESSQRCFKQGEYERRNSLHYPAEEECP